MTEVDEFLEDLVFKGEANREVAAFGKRWRLRVLTMEEYRVVYAGLATFDDQVERAVRLKINVLALALIMVNDVPMDRQRARRAVNELPFVVVDKLYALYTMLEIDYQSLIRDTNRLQRLVENNFSRIRFKVMKTFGVLPTEERSMRMRDVQWMWCYMNIIEDMKEDAKRRRDELEYLAAFYNPEGVKSVQEQRALSETSGGGARRTVSSDGTHEVIHHEQRVNSDFERELAEAMGDEQPMDIGNEKYRGNATESEDDFMSRVLANQAFAKDKNEHVFAAHRDEQAKHEIEQVHAEAKAAGVNPDELDFVEVNTRPSW